MKKIAHNHVFTSESVSEGHPDKVADQISDAILDACIKKDPDARVACETSVGPNVVINLGEITTRDFATINVEKIARDDHYFDAALRRRLDHSREGREELCSALAHLVRR